MSRISEEKIHQDFNSIMNKANLEFQSNPMINTTWEKKNGMYVQLSLYSDDNLCTTTNGNIKLINQ